ncbi:hypothetical protein WR25_14242 [Diploscapter pachys]|uniref:ubiquitinyl hydrolase 1 n=1 Tax=Diploscapter pachys TaxID=2018661 RepID=A0A2A2KQE9_9BILA|nr:hypothetical protein WR25_14242 [Diploscapter pachys]
MEVQKNENGTKPADEMPVNPESRHETFQFSNKERKKRQHDFMDKIINEQYEKVKIEGDGNCLFRSVALNIYGSQDHHQRVREECCNEMLTSAEFYAPFCVDENTRTQIDIHEYIETIRGDGVWEGELALRVMAKCYEKPIEVLAMTETGSNLTIYPCEEARMHEEPIRLLFRSGHYDAVVNNLSNTSPPLKKSKLETEVKAVPGSLHGDVPLILRDSKKTEPNISERSQSSNSAQIM